MSGGGAGLGVLLFIIPAVALAGAVLVMAAIAATVGAAALLVVRAAAAGVAKGADAVARLGAELEAQGEAQATAEIMGRLWELAAGEVTGLNAEIALLAAAAGRSPGPVLDLPEQLDLTGVDLCTAEVWVKDARARLRVARQALEARFSAGARDAMAAALPAGDPVLSAAELIEQRRAELLAGMTPTVVIRQPGVADDGIDFALDIQPELDDLLASVDPDRLEDDQHEVLRLAARVATDSLDMAEARLNDLKLCIEREVNPRAVARRKASFWLQALRQPLIGPELGVEPPTAALVNRLELVLRGERALTEQDRREAEAAMVRAEEIARCRHLRDLVAAGLEQARCEVRIETVSGRVGLTVHRPGWNRHHLGRIELSADHVDSRLWRTRSAAGVQSQQQERANCADFAEVVNGVFAQLQANGELGGRPVRLDLRHEVVDAPTGLIEAPGQTSTTPDYKVIK
ncbi:hypothetical protein ACFQY4_05490 [Catellatospora bangladeshensis]|uniref:Uncharacterized protein n=1 Tax=Catellatospora bangladeshensis TaxID=310355 RepID=A0A8J3JM46_9ACTN|nr:hypothetical protein [Catellatospora bangladeshensis]GIF83161.1 hypothetical protein Cba03nite_45100 [Catellatospora bangladeshensis]